MPAPKPSASPLDAARAAFESLSTPDKTAFAVEATFGAIAHAVADAGRIVSDALGQMSAAFEQAGEAPSAPEPPGAAPPRPPRVPRPPRKPRASE